MHACLSPVTKSFATLVSSVFGFLTTRLTSDAKDFVIAKSHARQKQLLTEYLRTVVVYAFSEHKAKLYVTCILCIYTLIFGFYHAFGRSVIIMLRILNIGLVNRSVNVTEVYHRRV